MILIGSEELKSKYPKITYADLYQLAGVVAVEIAGGPKITFTPGRIDSTSSHGEWSRLPSPTAGCSLLSLLLVCTVRSEFARL